MSRDYASKSANRHFQLRRLLAYSNFVALCSSDFTLCDHGPFFLSLYF